MSYHFSKLSFPKTGEEIKKQAEEKIEKLQAKIEERKRLIAEHAAQLGIESVEDALTRAEELGLELTDAEDQVAHTKMLSNRSRAKEEQSEIRQLEMLVRNLPDDETYKLDFDSLQYFGF